MFGRQSKSSEATRTTPARRTTKFGRPGTAGGRAYNLAVLCGLFDERKVAEEAHAEAKEEEEDDEG